MSQVRKRKNSFDLNDISNKKGTFEDLNTYKYNRNFITNYYLTAKKHSEIFKKVLDNLQYICHNHYLVNNISTYFLYEEIKENYSIQLNKMATIIQKAFRKARYNPSYKMCRKIYIDSLNEIIPQNEEDVSAIINKTNNGCLIAKSSFPKMTDVVSQVINIIRRKKCHKPSDEIFNFRLRFARTKTIAQEIYNYTKSFNKSYHLFNYIKKNSSGNKYAVLNLLNQIPRKRLGILNLKPTINQRNDILSGRGEGWFLYCVVKYMTKSEKEIFFRNISSVEKAWLSLISIENIKNEKALEL